ncbi:hypothetical protein BT93_L4157 [Corymbia citriodora subsp. variegata]|uniref:Succinate-semialdehyde dehydrogenase, mitochondrial n=1 Tax=Corymbia citriodora subsp. variegata TaxID=360336 RepID=A0A8T0CGH5_CORYI|nr:hypothetical protein BT93_L4157 [Corymbia citriodora subsp. variegata]
MLPRQRANILRAWYDECQKNAADLATLITWENGKPLADAKGEVTYASNFFLWFSEEAAHIHGDVVPSSVPGNRVTAIKQPVGVCGLITPWNFPAAMITRKIAPALAAGCTVVAKSPGETPFTANALAELSRRAGVPKGVVNFVTALQNTAEVGETLTTDKRIKKVSFTGSTNVGKLLMKQASSTIKKVSWELGGNAPFIVFDDCNDLDAAVAGAIACKFRSSGQTCVCANRLYVQEGIYDKFAEKLAAKVNDFKVGYGFDDGVTHGPVIHDRAVSKVDAHVQDAQKKGGKVIVGGKKLPDLGPNFYAPTVITGATGEMDLAQEETFGPVAGLFKFKTEKEVVELANDTDVGLAGYFYSGNVNRIYRVAEALEVGMVGVNTGLISDAAAPFGGVKESGFGREGSKHGIDEYSVIKSITIGAKTPPTSAMHNPITSSLTCHRCDDLSFTPLKELRAHCQEEHSEYWCDRCEWLFEGDDEKASHYDDSENHWQCSHCDKDVVSENELRIHQALSHQYCYDCEIDFGEYIEHRHEAHYLCYSCGDEVCDEATLKAHQERHAREVYKCYGCIVNFVSHFSIIEHIEAGKCKSDPDAVTIDYLAKNFRHAHRYLARGNEAYECCDLAFSTVSKLFKHYASSECLVGEKVWVNEFREYIADQVKGLASCFGRRGRYNRRLAVSVEPA